MTRQDLYELVWQTPSVHVARRLGMSIGAFRALCATYNVPLPPAGYWTKVAFGQQPARPPLPASAPNLLNKVELALRRIGRAAIDVTDAQIASHRLDFSALEAGEPHALAGAVAAQLMRAAADADGFVSFERPGDLTVRVDADSRERVVALLDTLLQCALAAGFRPAGPADGPLLFEDVPFAMRIYETRERRQRPSGRLCLEIFDPRPLKWSPRNLVGHCHDRGGSRVEAAAAAAFAAARNVTPLIRGIYAAHEEARGRHEAAEQAARRAAHLARQNEHVAALGRRYAEYLGMSALHSQLADEALAPGSRAARLRDALAAQLADLETRFAADGIEAELTELRLFERD
jgi:hypothetical protein